MKCTKEDEHLRIYGMREYVRSWVHGDSGNVSGERETVTVAGDSDSGGAENSDSGGGVTQSG